jgi:short-subunit dehydrogenase
VAVVTGASTGIGKDLAEACARDGNDLVLVARRADVLKQVAVDLEKRYPIRVDVITEDLTDSTAPGRILTQLNALSIQPEILINNAGSGAYGRLQETDMN